MTGVVLRVRVAAALAAIGGLVAVGLTVPAFPVVAAAAAVSDPTPLQGKPVPDAAAPVVDPAAKTPALVPAVLPGAGSVVEAPGSRAVPMSSWHRASEQTRRPLSAAG